MYDSPCPAAGCFFCRIDLLLKNSLDFALYRDKALCHTLHAWHADALCRIHLSFPFQIIHFEYWQQRHKAHTSPKMMHYRKRMIIPASNLCLLSSHASTGLLVQVQHHTQQCSIFKPKLYKVIFAFRTLWGHLWSLKAYIDPWGPLIICWCFF